MNKLKGFYKGKVLNLPLGWIWRGKNFYGITNDKVINKILGFWAIEGNVTYMTNGAVTIRYPQLGLEDTLVPVTPDFYLGILWLGRFRIFFSLTKTEEK